MSVATRKGDEGETDLQFGRRVSKADPRVAACGDVDELNAALGWARVWVQTELAAGELARIQPELVLLMGELMTWNEDLPRYFESGQNPVTASMVENLDEIVRQVEEGHGISFAHWAMPGEAGRAGGAALDLARTIARRAERKIVALFEDGTLENREMIRYCNRLSDVLWLLARLEENGEGR